MEKHARIMILMMNHIFIGNVFTLKYRFLNEVEYWSQCNQLTLFAKLADLSE